MEIRLYPVNSLVIRRSKNTWKISTKKSRSSSLKSFRLGVSFCKQELRTKTGLGCSLFSLLTSEAPNSGCKWFGGLQDLESSVVLARMKCAKENPIPVNEDDLQQKTVGQRASQIQEKRGQKITCSINKSGRANREDTKAYQRRSNSPRRKQGMFRPRGRYQIQWWSPYPCIHSGTAPA